MLCHIVWLVKDPLPFHWRWLLVNDRFNRSVVVLVDQLSAINNINLSAKFSPIIVGVFSYVVVALVILQQLDIFKIILFSW